MDVREQRALIIAAMCRIDKKDGAWLVPSQSASGRKYAVKLDGDGICTCPDHVESGFCCKHIRAVKITLRRELGMDGTITETKTVTVTEKKTYPRDMASFNAAQSVEKDRVQELLREMCSKLPEPERAKRGRKPHSIKDAIFAMMMKVYGTKASRTTSPDLRHAHENGFISKPIPGMKVCAFFENPVFTPILNLLVSCSAWPLNVVETKFAVDSTGFSCSKYERWFDHKYGAPKQKALWVKAHIACGTKTNIVTAVRILDKNAADSPEFESLVKRTATGFMVDEVYADKAYLSRENVEAVFDIGATPFIHPKGNTTGSAGGLFEKMFHYFQFRQQEFLDHYHQRSNVETAFSMVKKKFGDFVRSKTETAMKNEVLCKFLCHNLSVLNQEQFELGIKPEFWGSRT